MTRSTIIEAAAQKWFDAGFRWTDIDAEYQRMERETDGAGLPICWRDEDIARQLDEALAKRLSAGLQ